MVHWCGLKKPPGADWGVRPVVPVHSGSSLLAAWAHRCYGLASRPGDLALWGGKKKKKDWFKSDEDCDYDTVSRNGDKHTVFKSLSDELNLVWGSSESPLVFQNLKCQCIQNLKKKKKNNMERMCVIFKFQCLFLWNSYLRILTDLRVMEGKNPLTTRWISWAR